MVSGKNFPTHYLSGQGQHAKNHKYLKPSGPLSHLPTLMSSSVKKVCTLIFQFQYDMAANSRKFAQNLTFYKSGCGLY